MSYACHVWTDNGVKGATNALRFATKKETLAYGAELSSRWFSVTKYEAVRCPDPVRDVFIFELWRSVPCSDLKAFMVRVEYQTPSLRAAVRTLGILAPGADAAGLIARKRFEAKRYPVHAVDVSPVATVAIETVTVSQ
jgi:hypothetical protein